MLMRQAQTLTIDLSLLPPSLLDGSVWLYDLFGGDNATGKRLATNTPAYHCALLQSSASLGSVLCAALIKTKAARRGSPF